MIIYLVILWFIGGEKFSVILIGFSVLNESKMHQLRFFVNTKAQGNIFRVSRSFISFRNFFGHPVLILMHLVFILVQCLFEQLTPYHSAPVHE